MRRGEGHDMGVRLMLERSRRSLVTLLAALTAIALAGQGCALSGLAFVEDERVELILPEDRTTVTLPVTVQWTAEDLAAGTRFGVVVDRSPQPPGQGLDWYARADDCVERDGCPDEEYLAARRVYTTTEDELVIEQVPTTVTARRYRHFHEVTVFLLDESGRRTGESAWSVQFEVASDE